MKSIFFRHLALAIAAGSLSVLSFAPFYCWWLAPFTLATLFWLWMRAETRWRAAAYGLGWGLGLFLTGVSWIYVSLHVYGGMPALLAALATLLFCSYLSLYPALAGALLHLKKGSPTQPVLLLLVAPALFVACEWLRGWILTGFPWLILGYTQVPDGWLSGYAPLAGAFGLSWLTALVAGVLVWLVAPGLSWRLRAGLLATLLVIGVSGMLLRQIEWSAPTGQPLTVSLLQGNVEQHLKWRPDQREAAQANYRDLVLQSRARLIVLPETALTQFFDEINPAYWGEIKRHAESLQGDILVGVPLAHRARGNDSDMLAYFNGVISLGQSPIQEYTKHHLVAFGEFVPPAFSWIYQWLQIPLAGFTPGSAKQAPMHVAGHRVAVNICYEDTFGAEIARALPEAELLVNVSNMAWYGRSLAASQHAQFSQMRALETSRWMLRATNTGLTAAVNERGIIVKALPQFTRGKLDVEAIPRQGLTPYARWGDGPILAIVFFALLTGWWLGKRKNVLIANK